MIKRSIALFLSVSLLFLFTCCSSEKTLNDSATFLTFTDDTGIDISLPAKPVRVAVLFSSFAEIWNLAGGEIYVTVGESIERGFAPEDTLLVDSSAGKAINTELLISYEPDFVICSADIEAQAQSAKLINAAGIPAAQFRVENFEDYLNVLKICTEITGNTESYSKNGTAVKEEIQKILAETNSSKEKTKILFIRAGSSAKSTKAKTANEHFACAMLNELGTYNIAENAPILLDGLSIEEILRENPEYIFISTMGDETAAKENMDSILSSQTWQSLDAVKNKKYFYLPKELFQYKPNARWAQAYVFLAGILQ